jgi:hypothetical protein
MSRLRTGCIAVAALLLLAACSNNQYGPPVEGQPMTAGQRHYMQQQYYMHYGRFQ